MRLLVTCVLVGCLGVGALTGRAHAQEEGAPLVLTVDGAAARLSVVRLRRALAAVLDRPMVRVTDPAASEAVGTLTLAFMAPRSWVIRLDAGTSHVSRTIEVRGPALETLVGIAVDLVRRGLPAETATTVTRREGGSSASNPASTITTSTDASGHSSVVVEPWADPRVVIASEILDPFAGMPLTRVSIAAVSELLDPFTAVGSSIRVASSPEVLDPWR